MKVKRVVFPCDQPNWCRIKVLLRQLKERFLREDCDLDKCAQFHQEMYEVSASNALSEKGRHAPQNCIMIGLFRFFREVMDAEERSHTMRVILPFVIDTALQIDKLVPHGGLPILEQQIGKTVELSRKLVASILACALLCLFPERVRDKTAKLNFINFTAFFDYLTSPSQQAKLRGILHYFDRLRGNGGDLGGVITFTRQVMNKEDIPNLESWLTSDVELCDLVADDNGAIEKAGCDTLQISFSNSFIGGGVLLHGRSQEEIRFSMCPELLSSLLFTERMLENEAILIKGFEQFSDFEGFNNSLVFSGNYTDQAETDQSGNLQTALCAIDAASFKLGTKDRQYREGFLLRDLNKAVVGFKLCEEKFNTLKVSKSSTRLEPSSSEDDYLTAQENHTEEGDSTAVPESISKLASSLSEDVISLAVRQAAALQTSKKLSTIENTLDQEDKNNSHYEFGDFSHSLELSTSPVPSQQSQDYLSVDLDQFLREGRRRSSNLSDLASRRSSSTCSAKYSSEFSSEFEEYYETFQKQELKHGTIKEEVGGSSIYEFANVLASRLLQEGSSTAVQSGQLSGVQTFDSIPLPLETKKPIPRRTPISQQDPSLIIPDSETSSSSLNILYPAGMPLKSSEPERHYHEIENNNILTMTDLDMEISQRKKSSPYIFDESRTDLDEELAKKLPSNVGDYASSLSRIVLNLGLSDLSQKQHDCEVCRDRANSDDVSELRQRTTDALILKQTSSDALSPYDVQKAKIGLILADKLVNEIMADLRQEFLSGSLCFDNFQQCDISKTYSENRSNINSENENVYDAKMLNVKPDSTKEDVKIEKLKILKQNGTKSDELKPRRDSRPKAIDFCEIVDVRQPPAEDPTLEEEMFNYAQAFTDNIISEACREFNTGWLLKSHLRRSSEPNHKTKSFHAFMGTNKRSSSPNEKRFLRRHYHNSFSVEMSRWHSSEDVGRQRHGFQDETLSSFDELLQRSNPYIPCLELFQTQRRGSMSSDHGSSRRSSCSGFRDNLLASFEEELILTSADQKASQSADGADARSKSSTSLSPRSNHDGYGARAVRTNSCPDNQHFEIHKTAADFEIGADDICLTVEADPIPSNDDDRPLCEHFEDAIDIPISVLEKFSLPLSDHILSTAIYEAASIVKAKHIQDYKRRMRPVATGNWGCGVLGGDPQLKAMLQWAAASQVKAPALLYFTFGNEQMIQLKEVQEAIRSRCWTVGRMMTAVKTYCDQTLIEVDREEIPSQSLFHFLLYSPSFVQQLNLPKS